MTEPLAKAMAKARDLDPDMQDAVAQLTLTFVSDTSSIYRFTPEAAAEQDAADAEEARGAYATEAEVRAIWAKSGL